MLKARVSYDGNGNILTYNRKSVTGANMDNLTYSYRPDTNRLKQITDTDGQNSNFFDLGNQPNNNYVYDSIGNLKSNASEYISDIRWNVYGKIKELTKYDGHYNLTLKNRYEYAAQGNRISTAADIDEPWYYTWYVRDEKAIF